MARINNRENTVEDERIFMITGKTTSEVLNEYTLQELLRLQMMLVFLNNMPL